MKVSVIIPTYNEENVIKDCLESLARQSYKDMEIVVVDDGSVDKTLAEIRDAKYEIRVFKQKHKGAGAARNLGARRAKGDILVFMDADMTFAPDFIKKLVGPIIKGKVVGTFSKEEFLANKDNLWARCWNINRGFPADRMHPSDYPDTQKVFRAITKSAFNKAGGFDEVAGYTDDWSLAEKLGVEAVVAPGAIFYHKNPDNLGDVFSQSRWMAKRRYKLGAAGGLIALARVSLPVAAVLGIVKALVHGLPAFVPFKIVSDLGAFLGILEFLALGKVSK